MHTISNDELRVILASMPSEKLTQGSHEGEYTSGDWKLSFWIKIENHSVRGYQLHGEEFQERDYSVDVTIHHATLEYIGDEEPEEVALTMEQGRALRDWIDFRFVTRD